MDRSVVFRKVVEKDPPMGRIVLNGSPAEDRVINVARVEIIDANDGSIEEDGDSTTTGGDAESSGSGDISSGGGRSLSPVPLLLPSLVLGISKKNGMRKRSIVG